MSTVNKSNGENDDAEANELLNIMFNSVVGDLETNDYEIGQQKNMEMTATLVARE